MELRSIIEEINKEQQAVGGIKNVVWLAAGGSYGGFYPGDYFLNQEASEIRSRNITSNEFVKAPPAFVGKNTLAVICSMRGTPETIEAAKLAKKLGAATIALYVDESELTEICDYQIGYDSVAVDSSDFSKTNSAYGLKIAMLVMDVVEGYEHIELALENFKAVNNIYNQAVTKIRTKAIKWAIQNRESTSVHVMASGATFGAAYVFSICNIMEMLQIDSPTVNCCDFFHGPFEVIDEETSVFLLIGEGNNRSNDERADRFLKEFGGKKVFRLDAQDIGINKFDSKVSEHFNHLIFSPILNNVFMRELAYQIKKDYMTRTYMWKAQYN
ncbi:sugar isomerase [Candidatus Enterococcus murrayae]|uniref:Sugar isomerase n=1 Tax=Candidatus Enterococcus murrayae TaxID=2815321 RepID=A0ABS3HE04_9ENTE|nr:sugar isomerase [Enterococcus sp. MJM16]MBO0450828.1 sugar isomerase [Enterococcus sp. MJM16]